jgi:Raf kinase inhibitor-like YbhB/YbcL family protein
MATVFAENLLVDIEFNKGTFPVKHTCDGDDRSPAIRIDRIDAKFLAIILDDIFGPSESVTHWLIWNIEPRNSIPENIPKTPEITEPFPAVQGTNDFGQIGYRGPCPPSGVVHTYYFNVYGLDARLEIPAGSDKKTLMAAMKGHMVQYGNEAIATYGR